MNNLSVENRKDADNLLMRWGNWAAANGHYQGYPNMSTFRRLQGQGIGSAGLTDEEGSKIDEIISQLGRSEKKAVEVVVMYYIHGFDLKGMTHHIGVKFGKARELRELAITWVTARLFGDTV